MHQMQRNGIENQQIKGVENQGFAWQSNEMKQSQQQSPSFSSSFHRLSIQEDPNVKKKQDDQERLSGEEAKKIEADQEKELKNEEGQQGKKLNRSQMQTLNNSIDKLLGDYTTVGGQDMTNYIIFKDFQSDSKANSKYGSKRDSKQETPKYTPRFNFYTPDMLHTNQDAPFFDKPLKNGSNYQSQESFCFKEDRNLGSINPNSQNDFQNIGVNNIFQNFYSTLPQQNAQKNDQIVYNDNEGNDFYPYMIYQKNDNKQFEKQQQLNSYHLPQQKKKKMMGNNGQNVHNNGNAYNLKNNGNLKHQMNGDIQINNNNKQMSMMIMMSQVQTHQKQYRLSKLQALQNNEKQSQKNSNYNGRVCQTEPAQDELGEESTEYISHYKDALAHQENGSNNHTWNDYEEQMIITGNHRKQQLNTSDNQSFGNSIYNTSDFRNISQSKKPLEVNGHKQVLNGVDQDNQDNMKDDDSSYNEEESYDVDQLRQNLLSEQHKFAQQNVGLSNNPKHNNFINQKLYQNQMSKIRQQVMMQQQNNNKVNQKSNGLESMQQEHQNRIIKRINTNPTGIGPSQQMPIRVGSGDSRRINQINGQKNFLHINGDSNKIVNGKNGVNDISNFNHSQRKFRQMSAHAGSNNNYSNNTVNNNNYTQVQNEKNNHLIDEDYNNESFINLNNIPQDINIMISEGSQNQFSKQSPYQNNFIKQSQPSKLDPYNQNHLQQSSSIKRQINFKNFQDEIALNSQLEKQNLKKKIQEFEKKKNINLNNNQQQVIPQQPSSSSQSSGNNSKIHPNQQQIQTTITQSATAAATAAAIAVAQQAKKNSSLSRKKRSKTKSPGQKGLDSIMEVSQRFENNSLAQSNLTDMQLKNKFSNSDQKKYTQQSNQSGNFSSVNYVNNQSNQNQSQSDASNEYEQHNFGKVICKTEGNDSSSSFKVNIDENDSNRYTKTEQDYQQLSTSASSTNKFSNSIQNQENTLSQTKSANSKMFQKGAKRIQSANYNQSSISANNNLLHPQIALAINNQQNPQMNNLTNPSSQQILQLQSNVQRGRFNSYHGSQNSNQLNIQQLTKKLNHQSLSTTNNNAQQASLTNTLLKNQQKKRSFTPLSAANNINSNNQFQSSTLKDTFFLNPNEQSLLTGSKNNIKKITRNQKNYPAHSQLEKDQLNLNMSGSYVQQLSPISYQQLQINTQQQLQGQPQVFPNLQKQLAKRIEVGSASSQSSNQQQQQQQQMIIQQRPSSRQVAIQNQQLNINQQWQAQKAKQNISNNNNNTILNQTLSNKSAKI